MFKLKTITIYGYTLATGLSMILFYIWICAYLNDNKVTVTINQHGEATIELIIFPITITLITLGFILYLWENKKT